MYYLELHLTWILLTESYWWIRFLHSSLVYIFHNRTSNNKINLLHEKCLRIAYNDNKPSFQELLDKDKGVTIHVKNVRVLPVEIFKVSNNYWTSRTSKIFDTQNNVYDFQNPFEFLDEMHEVPSMVQKAFLFLVLKSGILYLVNWNN